MNLSSASSSVRRRLRFYCLAVLPAMLGCEQIGDNPPQEALQTQAAVVATAQPAAKSATLVQGPSTALRADLERRLSRSSITTAPLPEGGMMLKSPNGFQHVSVMSRRADGTTETTCLGSTAEIPALMERIEKGATP